MKASFSRRRQLLAASAAVASASLLPFPARAQERVLRVAAASGVSDVMRSIAKVVERQRPGLRIDFETGASDALAIRLIGHIRFDVVVFSDDLSMSKLVAANRVTRSKVFDFAKNNLALISRHKIASLADLEQEKFARIAIGEPREVPAGRYAREALVVGGLWQTLEPRMVYGSNVRQVLEYVARAGIDAGFVYKSDLITRSASGLQSLVLPVSVTHLIAPVNGSALADDANALIQFALSGAARTALAQLNFQVP
jgi:molybdate transport system substrate-binding protein